MMNDPQIGQKVITHDYFYANGRRWTGTIGRIIDVYDDGVIRVRFLDGYESDLLAEDFELTYDSDFISGWQDA